MTDLMLKALTQSDWEAFALTLPDTATIDEIGPIEDAPGYHINLRLTTDPAPIVASLPPTITWLDPRLIATPSRIFSGGMSYWLPDDT